MRRIKLTVCLYSVLHFQVLHVPPAGEAEALRKCNEPLGGQNLQNVQLQHAGKHSSPVCMFSHKLTNTET